MAIEMIWPVKLLKLKQKKNATTIKTMFPLQKTL